MSILNQNLVTVLDATSGGGGGGPTTLFYDTFTDSNGTALGSHTPDIDTVGSGWTVQNGTFDIQTNRANNSNVAAAPGNVATCGALGADVTATLTVNMALTGQAGMAFRYSDNDNFWMFVLYETPDEGRLYERNGGTSTLRDTTSLTLNNGTDYDLEVVTSGTTITTKIDGANAGGYGSATFNQSATILGLRFGGIANNTGDDYLVVG